MTVFLWNSCCSGLNQFGLFTNKEREMKKHFAFSQLPALCLASCALLPAIAHADFSGNIGLTSKYLFRGGVESDRIALQGGLDYNHASGFYAGWWASTLDYSYDKDGNDSSDGIENDFYLGFSNEINGFTYDITLLQYAYMHVDDSNQTELNASVGYGAFTVGLSYMLKEGWWGNKGDIYYYLGAEFALPKDFTFAAKAGFFNYDRDDNSKICYPDPAGCGITAKSAGFRHLDMTLSHPIGKTGADMSVTYAVGGDFRDDSKVDNQLLLGLTYNFDF